MVTTKQIADAVGKKERTVHYWLEKAAARNALISAKIAEARTTGKPASYDLDETVAVIEIGLGKNAAAMWRENAERSSLLAIDAIAAIVRETVASMVPILIAAVRGAVPERAVASLPAPEAFSTRDQLRRIVNAYAARSGDHRGAWSELYSQFFYRYHRNIRECAKHRGLDTLDYAENEGIIGDLLALAVDIYGSAA